MSPGKIASQAGHAYLDSYLAADANRAAEYKGDGHGIKICLSVPSLDALFRAHQDTQRLGLPCALVTDLGYTVFEGVPTTTALGIGPVRKSECAGILRRFKLLT